MATIEQRTFGRTDILVSALGFGAAPIGLLATEQEQAAKVLNLLLDSGVNLIDTAAGYAGSEEVIGNAVSSRRDEYTLVSKCGRASSDLPGEDWSPEVITATVDRALRRLKTDHLDVMLLHSCTQDVLEKGDAVGALVKARDAGKIRFAGYSGDNEAAAFATTLSDIAVLETSINICDQRNIDAVLPLTRESGIGVIAKRPIANTAWRPLDELKGMYKDYAKSYHERFAKMDMKLEDFREDLSWYELALLFTLAQPGVDTAIIGTTSPENAHRNVETARRPPLSVETVKKIRAAFEAAEKQSGETWKALQ